jgi:glucokinase
LSGEKTAREALDLFVRWLGRFAGDMALAFASRGGVYIGGGIAPHIGGLLRQQSFIDAFQSKGRMQGFLAPIPLHIIKASDAGLRGVSIALSNASPVQ